MFEFIHEHLEAKGLKLSSGTIVDATIIHAPSSTKNEEKARDPEMHQTKKGNQWYFGMKAHFGVDCRIKVIHSVVATAANVHDSAVLGGRSARIECEAGRGTGGLDDRCTSPPLTPGRYGQGDELHAQPLAIVHPVP
jgi:IS5 family transposase